MCGVLLCPRRHTSWESLRQLVPRKKKKKKRKKRNAHRGLFLHDLTSLPVTTLGFLPGSRRLHRSRSARAGGFGAGLSNCH